MRVELLLRKAFFALILGTLVGCGGSADVPEETEAAKKPSSSAKSQAAREPAPEQNQVVLETTMGRVVFELDEEHAPLTVANFLQYVESGHYDGTVFHQVVDGYIVLAGAYTPELDEKPAGVTIRNEADNGLKNKRGTIAMAREFDRIDSSTCQFFINLSDNPELDHQGRTAEDYGYCVFGRVVEGLDVVEKIAKVEAHNTEQFELIPIKPVVIKTAQHAGSPGSSRVARPSGASLQR